MTLKRGQHSKYLPFAFTEQGVAMLSSVPNSDRAIEVNIAIMRAFVQLRKMIASNKELARKLDELEKKYGSPEDGPASKSTNATWQEAIDDDESDETCLICDL